MDAGERKRTGAWYTPLELVHHVVANTAVGVRAGTRVTVLDPACGDGRFLFAAAAAIVAAGATPALTGVDIDLGGLRASGRIDEVEAIEADALSHDWGSRRFDIVVGNPPFLSQLATATARGASRFGGGPYADAAADFLALSSRVLAQGGRAGLVLPLSLLSARDAGPIRAEIERDNALAWFWSSPTPMFEAAVRTCAIGFGRTVPSGTVSRTIGTGFADADPVVPPVPAPDRHWSWLLADPARPALPLLHTAGVLSDRALVTANFRDQYYGLVGSVADRDSGPPLVTTGLIDPGACHWGARPVRFAKQTYAAPRVDMSGFPPFMQRWAARCLVPKVLVATQTRVLEAVADPTGEWLPAVPVIRVVPADPADLWAVAAILTSPVASACVAAASAGSGLSPTTMRVSQRTLGEVPWPAGDLGPAVAALRAGDIAGCGRAVDAAYGVADDPLFAWWSEALSHIA